MATFADLAEHTGTLVAIIGSLATLTGLLALAIWKIVAKVAFTLKADIFIMIDTLDHRITEVWEEINIIRRQEIKEIIQRQDRLREELPEKYMRIEGIGYKNLAEGIERIERHFDQFAQDCRDGKCRAGK